MNNKDIKLPMFLSLISYSVSFLIMVLLTLGQSSVQGVFMSNGTDVKIFPAAMFTGILTLLMYVVFSLYMITYKGDNAKTAEIVMLIVYVVVNLLMTYMTTIVASLFYSRKGAEYIAASSSLGSAISLCTAPFSVIASVLMIVAIGRFGVSQNIVNPVKSESEK